MLFSAVEGVPGRFAGTTKEEWMAVLEDAARVGLLSPIGDGMYRIHPALPGYLAAGWQADDPDSYQEERQAAEQTLRAACAAFSQWLTRQIESGNAAVAYAVIGLQRRTLGAMLADALDRHAWGDAESIVRALDAYWDTRGLGEEAAAWTDRILDATAGPNRDTPAAGTHAQELWLYTTVHRPPGRKTPGNWTRPRKLTGASSPTCRTSPKPNGPVETSPSIYHQLGMTAQDRGRLDEADDWYRKSLAIKKELGNRPGIASGYYQLGVTAQHRRRLDEADDWYRESLTIAEELGNRPGMALIYHQLGNDRPGPRGGWTRPTTGTANPSPSKKNSATAPAWRSPTTSSA